MAYIVDFSITGLAGRDDKYSQKLNQDVNVFFGLNGSGKTSLLNILHSALTAEGSILANTPFRQATVRIYSVDLKKMITRSVTKPERPTKDKVSPSIAPQAYLFPNMTGERYYNYVYSGHLPGTAQPQWKTEPPDAGKVPLGHRYLPTSRLWAYSEHSASVAERSPADLALIEERLNLGFEASLRQLWEAYIRGVLAQVRTAQEEGLTSILMEVLVGRKSAAKQPDLDSEVAYERVQSFLARQKTRAKSGSRKQFEARYARDRLLKGVVRHINDVEVGIARATEPRDKLQRLISTMFSGNKKVAFTDTEIEVHTKDDSRIAIASLSSGEKHALRILIETLYAGSGPLLIDEPEISMHVDWQKELIPSMRSVNGDGQLILATHSPEIMAPIPDDKIFRL